MTKTVLSLSIKNLSYFAEDWLTANACDSDINKSDLLNSNARQDLITLLHNEFPAAKISSISCKTGEGLSDWLTKVMNDNESGKQLLDIDYDTYAEGEAVLGWLNARFVLSAEEDINWTDFSREYLESAKNYFQSVNAQVGHVKLFLSVDGRNLTANLTTTDGPVLIQQANGPAQTKYADMTFNARVQMDPDQLKQISLEILSKYFPKISVQTQGIRSFRPGRPQPTHRYSKRV